jgi:KaiC/GvpD/RAD55 family RecA-like ATPase
VLAAWYARDPQARAVDAALLMQQGEAKITNPKHRDTLIEWLRELPDAPSADNVAQVALELKRHNVGMELAAAIANQDHKRTPALFAEYGELLQATQLQSKHRSEWQDAVPIEDLFKKVGSENRIPLSPLVINDRVGGGALPGHHIIVFGRPEAGKSTFVMNAAGSFAMRQVKTLYIGNEDPIDVLKSRAVSRITNMTWQEIEANKAKAIALYRKRGGEDFLIMKQLKHGSVDDVQRMLDVVQPQVLILDQFRNLQGDGDNLTKVMEKNAIKLRGVLLDYSLIGLSVTQANDRTERHGQEPPMWLGMGDIDSSRTGLPAQGDLIIGVGVNGELDSRNQRALSFPKNKLASKSNSHEGMIVNIDKSRSRFT